MDPAVIGSMVAVHADLSAVRVTCQGRTVATHQRSWATGLSITAAEHVATAKRLRAQFNTRTAPCAADDLVRDLADYDTAFGVDLSAGDGAGSGHGMGGQVA